MKRWKLGAMRGRKMNPTPFSPELRLRLKVKVKEKFNRYQFCQEASKGLFIGSLGMLAVVRYLPFDPFLGADKRLLYWKAHCFEKSGHYFVRETLPAFPPDPQIPRSNVHFAFLTLNVTENAEWARLLQPGFDRHPYRLHADAVTAVDRDTQLPKTRPDGPVRKCERFSQQSL